MASTGSILLPGSSNITGKPADPFSISNVQLRILEDREGNLWIGNYGRLDRLDRKTGKFYHYPNR
jgi:hypothetical protein